MDAQQYEITLPADYDMGVIRQRVAVGGRLLDDRAGLGLKAYVIRERGVDGSPVNQYAPVHLWNDTGAMAHFLGWAEVDSRTSSATSAAPPSNTGPASLPRRPRPRGVPPVGLAPPHPGPRRPWP